MFQKTMTVARKYAAPMAAGLSAIALNAHAQTASYDPIFDAIDLSGISVKVIAVAVVAIGIALVFKAQSLGKKTVNKA